LRIYFIQLHSEPGVKFNHAVTNSIQIPLGRSLSLLNKSFAHHDKLWKGNKYDIVFTYGATKKYDEVTIMGPLTLSKVREVHFSIFIPYLQFNEFKEEIFYILDCIKVGILLTFEKYKTDPSGVNETFSALKELIKINPEEYKKWLGAENNTTSKPIPTERPRP